MDKNDAKLKIKEQKQLTNKKLLEDQEILNNPEFINNSKQLIQKINEMFI
jgi:hypothetical protein